MALTGLAALFQLLRAIDEPARTRTANQPRRTIGPEQISLWSAIAGVVVPALLLIGGIVLSSYVNVPDALVSVAGLLCVGLELVAVGCGIVSRGTKSGRAGLIIGTILLLLCLMILPTTLVTRETTIRRESTELRDEPGTAPNTVFETSSAIHRLDTNTSDLSENLARGWIMDADVPRLTDTFANVVLKLQPEQTSRVNEILQAAHRDYLALEALQIEQRTDESEHFITRVKPMPIEKLEDRLWGQLDEVLNQEQQSIARLNLHLRVAEVRPPIALSALVRPGFFGWESHGTTIEIWRVGSWYHWKVRSRTYESTDRAPQLPAVYRRFDKPLTPP